MPARAAWASLAGAAAFQRLLSTRPKARTDHFVLHHVAVELSTGPHPSVASLVDESRRLGLVVPKRLARRAVTRNLIRRQARTLLSGAEGLPAGDWLLRQRAAFDVKLFPSAASQALRLAVRGELQQLITSAATRSRAASASFPASP